MRNGMMALFFKNIAGLCLAALLVLSACIPGKRTGADLTLTEAEQYVRKGDFEQALESYSAALRANPADGAVRKSYLDAVEVMEEAAGTAFDKGEFASSGRLYHVLLRNYPHFQNFTADLSFDRKYLQAQLTDCSDRLSERALAHYRLGNLSTAIALWENILEFEPGNAGVRKAIKTATTQLKSLQRKTE